MFSFFFDAILLYIQIMQTSHAIISAWMHALQSSPIWYLGLLHRLYSMGGNGAHKSYYRV